MEREIDVRTVERDPIRQFQIWFEEAVDAGVPQPDAMALASSTPDGMPSVRIVLLKIVDTRGFAFFTNYESRKGKELQANPHVAAVFHWKGIERQVRLEGSVERISDSESDAYFRSRPRESQISAVVSPQSAVIGGRKILEDRSAEFSAKHEGEEIPRPAFWGGFRIIPVRMEFWQSRRARLHDRIVYSKLNDTSWNIERLAP
ncbi:MAG TPA: pyridoxamine 5'-phosphate oxidase [Bacteroidota bacterium]|nr:pyridoxamine 5'-phosphate oxidase [Bacteroidota bacterium]